MELNLFNLKQKKSHFPVLIREVLFLLNNSNNTNQVVVDCTFGAGGYSEAILKYTKAKVIAIDRDKSAFTFANPLKLEYSDRFYFFHNTFSNIDKVLEQLSIPAVDAIIADLGVSTMQLLDKERGFSLQNEGPLSMAMGLNQFDAADFINTAKESELATVIWEYGEEPKSRVIAKAIIEARKKKQIVTTGQFSDIIHKALKRKVNKNGTNSATKTFQAIRIHVNGELLELITMLNKLPYLLNNMGKAIMLSFHSLEDRIIKIFFNDIAKHNNKEDNIGDKFTIFKPKNIKLEAKFNILTKKVIIPKEDELKANKNSSSAKLRAIQRVE